MGAENVLSQYEALINRLDFDALEPLIADDAVFWFNDGCHSGMAEIRTAFEKTWREFPLERYWLEDIRWLAAGEGAAGCVYRFRWRTTLGGKFLDGTGRGTALLRSERGQWKIVHEHLSQFPQ